MQICPFIFQLSINAWFWSSVFHTRDTNFTEVITKIFEASFVSLVNSALLNLRFVNRFCKFKIKINLESVKGHFYISIFFFQSYLVTAKLMCSLFLHQLYAIMLSDTTKEPLVSCNFINLFFTFQKMDYFCATLAVMSSILFCFIRYNILLSIGEGFGSTNVMDILSRENIFLLIGKILQRLC